jgi:hypothetical protein
MELHLDWIGSFGLVFSDGVTGSDFQGIGWWFFRDMV